MPGREERFGGRTKKPLDEMIDEALKNAPDINAPDIRNYPPQEPWEVRRWQLEYRRILGNEVHELHERRNYNNKA